MVILQFNKLIRNKWVWGAFAVLVSAAFCLDWLFTGNAAREVTSGDVGTLAGEAVDSELFARCLEDARGLGAMRDNKSSNAELNRKAWEMMAALKVANANGLTITDKALMSEIRRAFGGEQFTFEGYRQYLIGQLGVQPERFEKLYRNRLVVDNIVRQALGAGVFASPMALDQAVADATDEITVKVVRFSEDPAKAAAVKLDDAGLRAWYDKNVKKLALPERYRLRFVKYDATDAALQAKLTITEEDIHSHYDASIDRFTSTDTNGVETVKKYEEVKAELEAELRTLAAVECLETNLMRRAYAPVAKGEKAGASRVVAIATADGKTCEESRYFSLDSAFVEGFMVRPYSILPGAKGFSEAVSELDAKSEDFRYAVISSDKAVWLVEKIETSVAHTPSFEEAKDKIGARALVDAKDERFKTEVEAIVAKGTAALLATKQVSTNLVFSVSDLKGGTFPDQGLVSREAAKLKKGGVSSFVKTGTGKGLVVVCVDRKEGDAVKAIAMRESLRNRLTGTEVAFLADKWSKANLEKLGFTTTDVSSVEETIEE